MVLTVAVVGLLASLSIPKAPAEAPELKLGWNIVRHTWDMTRYAAEQRDIFLAILGISWFWLIGSVYLSQFPTFSKDVLGADNNVVTLFLTAFSLGIGAGSMLCSRLLRGEISARYVPLGALGVTLFTVDLYFASGPLEGGAVLGLSQFLRHPAAWRVVADLLLISVSSGFYIVPLYTIMQERSAPSHRSRVIAANNIINAVFMVAGSLITVGLIALHVGVPGIFLTMGALNFLVAIYICKLLPDVVVKGAGGGAVAPGLSRRSPRPGELPCRRTAHGDRRQSRLVPRCHFACRLPARPAHFCRQFPHGRDLVGSSGSVPGRCLPHGSDEPDGDEVADPCAEGRAAMRDLSRRPHHRHRRADEGL